MTGTVLGTRVLPLPVPAGRERALLISDLHVPADGGPVLERLQLWLDAAMAMSARLFVLGDLFDSVASPRQSAVGVWRDVAQRLRRCADAGVPITVLHGNRDFLLGRAFAAAAAAQVVAGGVCTGLAGHRALLLHGDELCQNDLAYQRAKRWLRGPLVRLLAQCLPLRVALQVAERARRRSRAVTAMGDAARFWPTAPAVAAAFGSGADLLVFGHVHAACRGRLPAGQYCVLPAFDQAGVGLCADAQGIAYLAPDATGARLVPQPDPPPTVFAAAMHG